MSNFEERLAASQELLEAAVEDEITAAGQALTAIGCDQCIDCFSPLSPARRAAAPFAVRCVECQAQHERERYLR